MGRARKQNCIDLGRCRVREDIGEKILALLEDPMNPGKTKYGAFKALLERLFAQHLHELEAISDDKLKELLENERHINSGN